ncbi:hypothetical protein DITRI_Ditri10aG0172400 [Diplodiscus trichospermus]
MFWVYGAQMFEERKKVREELRRKIGTCEEPVMCIGDFNDIIREEEKEGGRRKDRRKINCFRDFVEGSGLQDVKAKGMKYTWSGIRKGKLVKEKLDRVLVNLDWMKAYPNMQATNLPVIGSNHFPVVMNIEFGDRKGGKRFKFESKWLLMEECAKIVKE